MDFYSRTSPARKRRWPRFFFGLGLLVTIGFMLTRSLRPDRIISPIPDDPQPATGFFSLFAKKKTPDELKRRIRELVGTNWKNYSVFVKDLRGGFAMGINENVIYTAASLYKVPVIAALYSEAQKGTIDLDNRITLQQKDIQDFGTGSIRYDPPGSIYSLKTLAKLMISQSDNTAGFMLGQQIVGYTRIGQYLASWGMTQTDMANNKTSNSDMAIIFEKIFNGSITNQAQTLEMLSFFKDTDFETRLPALLPAGTTVYHKIGNETAVVHDVGIVTQGNTAYYIGILSSDVPSEEEADILAGRISKLVYDYLVTQ